MRTSFAVFSACTCATIACSSNPAPNNSTRIQNPTREYAGVYTSTPDEDYFAPCGVPDVGDTWSLEFRDSERSAPFLKQVTAVRGYPPLTHFIRIRGRLGPPSTYNIGFQTRQLAVDSVLEVKETLQPCAGFGVPAGWAGVPQKISNPKALALSDDGSLAATMDAAHQITIWATDRGTVLKTFSPIVKGQPANSNALMTFSRDGKLLAVGINATVSVWRVADAKPVFTLSLKDSADVARERAGIPQTPGYTQPLPSSFYGIIQHLVFNKTGTMLATTNLLSSIVWSMKTGKKVAEFERGVDFHSKLLFVGNGLLMTADSGRMVIRPSVGAAPVIRPGTRAHATEYVEMSRDERWIALNGWGDTVFLWSVAESGPGVALPLPGRTPGALAFSPDGKVVATGGGSNGLYLWNTRTGAPIRSFHNFPGPVSHVWFLPDGKSIVTFSTFDDRFRIVYVDSALRAAAAARGNLYDSTVTAKLPLGPPPSNVPRTVGGLVASPNSRAVADAEVTIANGDVPDSVIARATSSSGGYFSFPGIRFRHIILRAHKAGFADGVRYVHIPPWSEIGPWGIELKPLRWPTDSAGVELH